MVAVGYDEAGPFGEEVTFFLFCTPEGADYFREEASPLSANAEEALAADLDFFRAGLYARSWSGSNTRT